MQSKKIIGFLKGAVAVLVFLSIWEAAPRLGLVSTFVLPPFTDVFSTFVSLLLSGELLLDIGVSLSRAAGGFVLAMAIGVPLGLIMGWYRGFESFVDPLLQIFRNTPVTAMYPVFMMFFGLGEFSKVAAIFWGCIWATLISTINGVKNVDHLLIKSARSMGTGNFTLFRKVVIPGAIPSIVTGARLSASTAVIILIAAEMLGGSVGVGIRIFSAQQLYKTSEMYAGIITIALLGVAINKFLVKMERHLTQWKDEAVGC